MQEWKELFPKKNIYFETKNGILYNGNCLEILDMFKDNLIDSIITSPPYNIGIDYGTYKDNLSFEEYYKFIEELIIQFNRILVDGGRFGINHLYDTNKPKRHSPLMEIYQLIKKHSNFYTIIDLKEKQTHRVKFTAWGSWLSPNSPYIYNAKEGIIVGYKKHWKRNKKGKTDLIKEEFMEYVTAEWNYFPQTKQLTKANFSEDIPYKWIKINTFINDIVLDPFMGSGTTAVVAEKLNRKWIGVELNPKFCEVAKQRILKITK